MKIQRPSQFTRAQRIIHNQIRLSFPQTALLTHRKPSRIVLLPERISSYHRSRYRPITGEERGAHSDVQTRIAQPQYLRRRQRRGSGQTHRDQRSVIAPHATKTTHLRRSAKVAAGHNMSLIYGKLRPRRQYIRSTIFISAGAEVHLYCASAISWHSLW